MPQQSWSASDFQGLTPGIDPRRSDKFFALDGQNYVFDSIGPRSDFGNRYLTTYALGRPEHAQGFRLKLRTGDRVFMMCRDCILEWKEDLHGWRVIYVCDIESIDPFTWTQAYLNGIQYFCHPAVGILEYDLDTDLCLPARESGAPAAATAICVTNGRLCAIDDTFFYFSATSDGQDWTPKLGGAGFYRISDRVSGSPVIITAVTTGALVWTTGGVMVAQFTGDSAVFRFRSLTTELRPINSFCTARMDVDTVVILDERGLFQTTGDKPTPFSPLFNEYLMKFIQRYNIKQGQNARLEWDELQRRLYVSLSLSYDSPLYEICFVLYPSIDKWGQFNEPHFGIVPVFIDSGSRADDFYGYVDAAGRVRYWNQLGTREVLPTSSVLNSIYPVIQKPSGYVADDSGYVLSSTAGANTTPTTNVSGRAGFYPYDGGTNIAPSFIGLSARLQLGLIHFDLQQTDDQLTELVQLSIGNSVEGDPTELSQGFSITPILSNETVALAPPNFINCQIRVISTMDGKSYFMDDVPLVTSQQRGMRHYSCSTVGIWHVLELKAEAPGEAFQLDSVSLTAAYAGKLG